MSCRASACRTCVIGYSGNSRLPQPGADLSALQTREVEVSGLHRPRGLERRTQTVSLRVRARLTSLSAPEIALAGRQKIGQQIGPAQQVRVLDQSHDAAGPHLAQPVGAQMKSARKDGQVAKRSRCP